MKPMIAAKIIYPKFMSLLLMISPSPVCQHSSECPPFICCKARQIQSEAEHHKLLLSTTEIACSHCPPKQGLESCIPYCSLNTFWFKAYPCRPPADVQASRQSMFPLQSHSPCRKTASENSSYGAQQRTVPQSICWCCAAVWCWLWSTHAGGDSGQAGSSFPDKARSTGTVGHLQQTRSDNLALMDSFSVFIL